ncbi:MAG: T9SS type A sorting domain-containing protein [bacterium]|nr:T9SS type A sorting domain-containing protein [bacterium]
MKHVVRVVFVVTLLGNLGWSATVPAVDLPQDVAYHQCGETWSNDLMGQPDACLETVCSTGCVVTSVAMLLSWQATEPGTPDPGELNDWLRANGGYFGCLPIWGFMGGYDGSGVGVEWVEKVTFASDDWAALDAELAASDRMPLANVHEGGHWVVVYERNGPSGVPSSYRILDPSSTMSPTGTLADYADGGQVVYGLSLFSGTFPMGEVTGVGEGVPASRSTVLRNIPNPFNPATTIAFELAEAGAVSLRVYDATGRLVDILLENAAATSGRNEVVWTGRDRTGRSVSAGVYFSVLKTAGHREMRKMVLVR